MSCEVCGAALVPRRDRTVRFCTRRCCGIAKRGRSIAAKNGGLSFDRASGRWKVMCRDGTQMWYSRAVMAGQLGRLLDPSELVHHRNENPADDRPENLELTDRSAHIEIHRDALLAARGLRRR